jgi:hypothetical protein
MVSQFTMVRSHLKNPMADVHVQWHVGTGIAKAILETSFNANDRLDKEDLRDVKTGCHCIASENYTVLLSPIMNWTEMSSIFWCIVSGEPTLGENAH